MAKEQDLPLNPLKISGLCGRLMCCLRYEYEAYKDFKQRAPKCGSPVETPDGLGKILSLNTPKEAVTLRLPDGTMVTVPLEGLDCSAGKGCPCKLKADAIKPPEPEFPEPVMLSKPVAKAPKSESAESGQTGETKSRRSRRSRKRKPGSAAGSQQSQQAEKSGQQQGQQKQQKKRQPKPQPKQGGEKGEAKPADEGTPSTSRRRRRRRPSSGGQGKPADKAE